MVVQRILVAINAHDLDAFVGCFAADYRSEQPAHPARAFQGREQVRKNWGTFFDLVPDLRADLLRSTVSGDVEWAEWYWHGTRTDGDPFRLRGVTLFGIRDDEFAWGRLYMEPVEEAGADIDRSIEQLTKSAPGSPPGR